MDNKLQKLFEQLIPFIILGISIALVVGLFIMLSYVLVWGFIIGGVIWLTVMIKNYFFKTKSSDKGRVIEHDEE
jgi:hypothetical protein